MKMISSVVLVITLTFFVELGFAQGRYFEGMPIKPNCPCEVPLIFRGRQSEINPNPVNPTFNCILSLPTASTAPEGIYLFKRKKKRPRPAYPKQTNIIRF